MSQKRFSLAAALLLTSYTFSGCAGGSTASTNGTPTPGNTIATVAPGRSMWFWESSAQQAIVSTPSQQAAVIAQLKTWNVTSLYGSYAVQIASSPAAVRAWNVKLAAAGIASYSLASGSDFFFPENWNETQTWIETNFLSFNAASQPGEGFVGIAFDVEPSAWAGSSTRASWATAGTTLHRTYLTYLTDMLQSTRSLLNADGYSTAAIQTYLVNGWDTLTGTIAWSSQSDMTQWFALLASICDRVTVEEYGTANTATILAAYQTNDALLNGKSRIALETDTTYFPTNTTFFATSTLLESTTGKFVDIEDYDTTVAAPQ